MDRLRQSLHDKVDALLFNIFGDQAVLDCSHLQIEACIQERQADTAATNSQTQRRIVIQSIDVDELRRTIRFTNCPSSSSANGLPSPITDRSPVNSPYSEQSNRRQGDLNEAEDQARQTRLSTRRNVVGGLRLGTGSHSTNTTPPTIPSPPTTRQLEADEGYFPKRRKLDKDRPAKLEQSTVDKLIEGIWEQIHRPQSLALGKDLGDVYNTITKRLSGNSSTTINRTDFVDASRCCQQVTSGSRTGRALEVIIEAHWVDCYEERIKSLRESRPDLKNPEIRKMVLTEACSLFQWSEKELRNREAIWRGYRDIRNAAGWAALIFAGPGIYRFCKYRLGFDADAIAKLQAIKLRIEVAADTLLPQWRELLSLVGAPTQIHYRGHPHDWVVSKRKDPVPLFVTYRKTQPDFTFTNITDCVIDTTKFPAPLDPRRSSPGPDFTCETCSLPQSLLPERNECECFPDLFRPGGGDPNLPLPLPLPRTPPPVQVFRTDNGRNNGLIACCQFPRGTAIGEFLGVITRDLADVDVMSMSMQTSPTSPSSSSSSSNSSGATSYQIHQGTKGNFTRFINHSCQPNSQFRSFTWLGIQRVVVVSLGVAAGKEITVDYSGRYWQHLDKVCLCGEARCRYNKTRENGTGGERCR